MVMIGNVNISCDQHIFANDHLIGGTTMKIELNARAIADLDSASIAHDFNPRSFSDAHTFANSHTAAVCKQSGRRDS
jgi:hypothetical protein